jgi:hypothetical protein
MMQWADRILGKPVDQNHGYLVHMLSARGVWVDQQSLTRDEAIAEARKVQPPKNIPGYRPDEQVESGVK